MLMVKKIIFVKQSNTFNLDKRYDSKHHLWVITSIDQYMKCRHYSIILKLFSNEKFVVEYINIIEDYICKASKQFHKKNILTGNTEIHVFKIFLLWPKILKFTDKRRLSIFEISPEIIAPSIENAEVKVSFDPL